MNFVYWPYNTKILPFSQKEFKRVRVSKTKYAATYFLLLHCPLLVS
jgi:hypothetical protein